MLHIFLGLLIAAVGILITLKAEWIYQNMGAVQSAENWLGSSGGSRLFYQLIGIIVTFIGFLMATNLLGKLILWAFLPLFTGFQKSTPLP